MGPGAVIEGRFRVVRLAGKGGFGTVYRAIDTTTARDVALKVFAREQTDFARFEREVEVLATVQHHHVVAYVGHGLTDDGSPYFAMEWLEGIDLARRLELGPLPLDEALTVMLRAAQGLAAAHAHGIVHRDVKPSNLFLVGDRADDVRVIDFGVARTRESFSRLTATGAVLGTPQYMAPEQARGARDITPRADVFALGTVLYECLVGAPAFDGPSPHAILAKILAGGLPRVADRRPDLPGVVDALLARMLAHEPGDRLADGVAVAQAISGLLAEGSSPSLGHGTPIPARPVRAHATVTARGTTRLTPRDRDELAAVAAELGGEVHAHGDDVLFASFSARDPADAARHGAAYAIALRRRAPQLAIAMLTLRRDTVATAPAVDAELAQRGMTLRDGCVVIDAATARHIGGDYELAEEGEQLLLRDVATPRAIGSGALRGRARELAAVDGAFAGVVEDRAPSLLLLLGEQGAGKTALLDAAVEHLCARAEAPRVLRARGDRPTSTSPFAIVAQLIRAREPGTRSRDGLRALLVADGVGGVDAEFACELAGYHNDASDARNLAAAQRDPLIMADAYRAAWLAFLETQLDAGALVLAVDDLELVDPASLHLIDVALQQLADRCLLVVATARPSTAAASLAVFEQRGPERVQLRPLRDHLATELVRDLAPAASNAVIAGIVARAAGNPLHLGELARVAASGGAQPDSLLGAIESRIARLDGSVQRVLHAASVFGLEFHEDGLTGLLGGEGRPRAALDTARRERLIMPAGDGSDGASWRFANALVQEALYAALTPAERAAAHGSAARWLEAQRSADPSVVAWHHERGDDSAAAVTWYAAAARLALDGRDVPRALALTGQALACNPSGDELARVLAVRAEAAFVGNDAGEGKRAALAALDAAQPGSLVWLAAAGLLITSAGQLGDNETVQQLADRVRRQPAEPRGGGARAVCLCRAASQLFAVGRYAIARELATEAQRCAGADLLAGAWLARMQAGFALLDDEYDPAIDAFGDAVRLFAAAGDVRASCQARILKASFHIFAGDLDGAETELDVADAMARRTGADYFTKWASYTRGKILALAAEPATAREHLERVRGMLASSPRIVAGTHIFLGLAALRAGDPTWAAAEARAALAAHGAGSTRAQALAVLARALARSRPSEALAAAEEAVAVMREHGRVDENEGVVHLALAEALQAAGQRDAARTAVEAAARRLWRIAGRLRTPQRAEAFLQRIEAHATTLRLAAELGITNPD